jgi:threonine dehydrogenase-like Zn-dependent dehydrogenase
MKAIAVVPNDCTVGIVDHPTPQIAAPTEVKLRMLEVGVCGTDREICAFQYGTPPVGSEHLIIGHESLGEVIEVGGAVSRVKVGDLVVTMVRRPCDHATCRACRADRQDFCYSGDFSERGIKRAHGFMTEYVVDDERYMNVVPRALRDVAILVEPLTIAEKALAQIWDVQERLPWDCPHIAHKGRGHCHTAVVLGAGPVGLLGAMALAAVDFDVFVYSREAAPNPKSAIVEAVGAHYVSTQTDSIAQLAARTGNVDVIYEATGASSVSFELLKILGTNGIFVFTGVPGRKAPIAVDTDLLMRDLVLKNQVVFGTVNAGRSTFEDAITDIQVFMRRWPNAVRSLITGRYPLAAHHELLLGPAQGIKNVICFDR